MGIKWHHLLTLRDSDFQTRILCLPKCQSSREDSVFVWLGAIPEYHRVGDLNNRSELSDSSEDWKSKIKVQQDWCLVTALPLGCRLSPSHCGRIWSLLHAEEGGQVRPLVFLLRKTLVLLAQGSTLMTLLTLISSLLELHLHWDVGLQNMNVMGGRIHSVHKREQRPFSNVQSQNDYSITVTHPTLKRMCCRKWERGLGSRK